MNHRSTAARVVLGLMLVMLAAAPRASADNGTDTGALRAAVTTGAIHDHLLALQTVGPRPTGSQGYTEAATYVADRLANAGYRVWLQPFSFEVYTELTPPILAQTYPGSVTYVPGVDFATMEYSGNGDLTAEVQPVDVVVPSPGGGTSGCEGSDFAGFVPGRIALMQRGTCTFELKAQNAEAAGASGVVIFNEGDSPDRTELIYGTLVEEGAVQIPVVGATYALGQILTGLVPSGLQLHLKTDGAVVTFITNNLIAESTTGRTDRVVVAGAHLDSTAAGPGIEDNGTGAATLLVTAEQMAALHIQPVNQVRFVFFSGEEQGLFGSYYYVDSLTPRDIRNTALFLDFDMIGSPNYVRFVYDGDGSAFPPPGPNGSANVEEVFLNYFAAESLATEPCPFDGRSDYQAFLDAGIPAGGLFTGAEEIKTPEQAAIFGGNAGQPLDPCYHFACDTLANVSFEALDQMSDAAAHAIMTFAMTTSAVNGTDKGKGRGGPEPEYLGPWLQR